MFLLLIFFVINSDLEFINKIYYYNKYIGGVGGIIIIFYDYMAKNAVIKTAAICFGLNNTSTKTRNRLKIKLLLKTGNNTGKICLTNLRTR